MRRNPASGFTLIELMITLAVAGVLLGIAVPAFNATMERNRLTNYSNELLGAFMYASNQARTLRQEIDLCSSANGSTCDADWNSSNQIILRQADGTLVRRLSSPPSNSTISVYAISFAWNDDSQQLTEQIHKNQDNDIRFQANGQLTPNANGTESRRFCLFLGAEQTPFSLFPSGQVKIQPEAACT